MSYHDKPQRVTKLDPHDMRDGSYRKWDGKELVETWNVLVKVRRSEQHADYIRTKEGGIRDLITVRTYMGRSRDASVVVAAIWVHLPDKVCAGVGTAGGYGYHKASAAIGEATGRAGITLAKSISGRGDSAIDEALRAIARRLGYKQCCIVKN